eukprot:TRINITY_DN776252_c0_g1_i1.p1 TRINITY_DN776252_c0_g1~~TRINITY_DN776252_c0_g1_i1.p1  ORF type:complete len:312 (-),score=81.69 TRINITY_DN776252_c0_g1_i1:213-1148(-)
METALPQSEQSIGFSELLTAIWERNEESVQLILDSHSLALRECVEERRGMTPLMIASEFREVEIVKALLENSRMEYREMVDYNGFTALHYAVKENCLEIVELLLKDSRENFREMTNLFGVDALEFAFSGSYENIVYALLKAGEELRHKHFEFGETPLHVAVSKGMLNIVKFLIGVTPLEYREMKNEFGNTALHLAAMSGHDKHKQITKELLNGANRGFSSMRNKDHKTAVDLATENIRHGPNQILGTITLLLIDERVEMLERSCIKYLFTLDVEEAGQSGSEENNLIMREDLFWSADSTVKEACLWIPDVF